MRDERYLPEGARIGTPENEFFTSGLGGVEAARDSGAIVEAIALGCSPRDMSLTVDLGGVRGIIPRDRAAKDECGVPARDIAVITRVARPVCFKVEAVLAGEGGETTAILSRRAAQEECERYYVSRLTPGDVIPATVTHLEPFGAFVDVGCGISSLLTVDSVSVSRISHPSDRFCEGQGISAVVRSVDRETGRIALTHRELLGTWEQNAEQISPGGTFRGIVRSVEDYGIFVELTPNLAGLAERRDGVAPGDGCAVFVKSVIPEKMKVKLVLIGSGGAAARTPLKYFITADSVDRIDRWRYSPACCQRVIETVFD